MTTSFGATFIDRSPGYGLDLKAIKLKRRTAAIEALPDENGRLRTGVMLHLVPGSQIEVVGKGFSERTVQVRCSGAYYFVLADSIRNDTERIIV